MNTLLTASLRSHLHKGRVLTLLTVLGVALGVATVLSVQILNASSMAAFRGGVRAVSGGADLIITARSGDLDPSLVGIALADPDVAAVWPLVRLRVAPIDDPTSIIEVIGFDAMSPVDREALPDMGQALSSGGLELDPMALLVETDLAAATLTLADRLGWSEGDRIELAVGSRVEELVIGPVVDLEALAPLAPSSLLIVDLATAQRLRERPAALTQVDLSLVVGADEDVVVHRLSTVIGDRAVVRTPAQREQDTASLTEAFRMNLSALSLVSVFVGMFLVISTVQASLSRRRIEFGVLRANGATRGRVLGLILAEAGVLGLVGVAVGIPLGWLTARANLSLVDGVLTNIYMLEGLAGLRMPPSQVVVAAATGALGAALGALAPALDVTSREPRDLLRRFVEPEQTSRTSMILAVSGLTVLGVAGGWFLVSGSAWRWSGFVLGLALLAAVVLLTPEVVRRIAAMARPRGFGFVLGARNLAVRLHTTSFAVAALGIAVTMMVSVTLLIAGFRGTLTTWLDDAVPADIYVTAGSWAGAGADAELENAVVNLLVTDPAVRAHALLRQVSTMVGGRAVELNGVTGVGVSPLPPLRDGDPERVATDLASGAVLVTEPLARKAGIDPGDTISVSTPFGGESLVVAGISYDYSSEHGAVLADLATVDRLFGPGRPHSIALYLDQGYEAGEVAERLRRELGDLPLDIRSNADLRREVLSIFDQTFAVTRLLQGTALLIAVAGISLTLLIRGRERGAELALYRALGATPSQVFRLVLGEGIGIGALGVVLGMTGGLGLALLLIHVINPAWFGWTLQRAWPLGGLALQAMLILVAAALAAVGPARRSGMALARELNLEDA